MKIFRFFQKVFFIGLTTLSNFTNASSPLSCISMKNQECKTRPQVVNVNGDEPMFFPKKQVNVVNVVVAVIILTIHMQRFVFLIL